jgi:DNA-binding CsgD family transcriptional regulator
MNSSELKERMKALDYILLGFLAKGMTSRQIAAELLLGEDAVDQMIYRMRLRIGAKNKAEAVAIGMKHKLIKV